MTQARNLEATPGRPLRLWPGIVAAALLLAVRFVLPLVVPETLSVGFIGSLIAAFAIVLWWLFFSRAPWIERLGALAVMIVGLWATPYFLHPSVAGGAMGMLFYLWAILVVSLALVVWAVASRSLSAGPRRLSMVVTLLLACGLLTLVRTGGVTSDVVGSELHWRWTPTPEERLLAQPGRRATALAPEAAPGIPAAAEWTAEWPGFRGPGRDGVVHGVRITTDWAASPPVELWRRPIGPGWSSFAVRGDRLYTQEQRGDDEIVSCYALSTGEPVWSHRDPVRFWESNAGAGPRATPTLDQGRVYALGATGILNALEAEDGSLVWSRNAASDTGREVPTWGFSSSPLVVDDLVIVALSGTLAAYDLATGEPRWVGPRHGGSYSSPQLVTLAGVPQVLLLSPPGATSLAPADGALLWEHTWEGGAIVQPAMTADGDLLVNASSTSGGIGIRRLAVTNGSGGWAVDERWTSNGLKPYFNDFVVGQGYAFGFDGSILSCIDLENGKRQWKGGRYGHGQLLLLADQDLLLVLSEKGELALVAATPDGYTELARTPAIEGKTWNHPALVGDVVLVRNGQEMAAFRLSAAKDRS